MRWLAIGIISLLVTASGAEEYVPIDNLVKMYMEMPCDVLFESLEFHFNEMNKGYDRVLECKLEMETQKKYKYGDIMCSYIVDKVEFTFHNYKAVEKALNVMCSAEGVKHKI